MSKFPDFKDVEFAAGTTAAAPEGAVWNTPEGVDVAPAFTADDTADLDFTGGYPGAGTPNPTFRNRPIASGRHEKPDRPQLGLKN